MPSVFRLLELPDLCRFLIQDLLPEKEEMTKHVMAF